MVDTRSYSNRRRRLVCFTEIGLFVLIIVFTTTPTISTGHRHQNNFNDDLLYFDRSLTDFETVLTSDDFDAGRQLALDPTAVDNDEYWWNSESMYSVDKFEGDIANPQLNATTIEAFITGAAKGGNGEQGLHANAIRNRYQLWADNKIPYAISSQYSSFSRSLIASSMQEYTDKTCVEFVPRTNEHNNYIYIYPDRGCYSMIIHEMMHAVGFFHEQSRTDRDNYISILWNNIQPGMQGQFEKYNSGTIQTLGTNYDYASIMHYGPKAFSRNGLPTIVPKQQITIGQRGGFSEVDIFKINKLYQCADRIVTTTTDVPTTTTDEVTTTESTTITTTKSTTTVDTPPPPPTSVTDDGSSSTITPPPPPPPPPVDCKDTRRDCPVLAQQGWCKRNPPWMKQYCAVSCDMCEKKPESICEDLRVDCHILLKQRYCKTSQVFMKSYCAKSCGFCTVLPPITELPETLTTPDDETTTIASTLTTTKNNSRHTWPPPGVITLWPTWPTLSPLTTTATDSTSQSTTISSESTTTTDGTPYCTDRKHFCVHWKNAGFCEGIFLVYMKKNCSKSCNLC